MTSSGQCAWSRRSDGQKFWDWRDFPSPIRFASMESESAGTPELVELSSLYLGPPDQVFARTADTSLELEDGVLPAHKAYLCTDNVLGEAVGLGLRQQGSAGVHLRLPLPGCRQAETAQLLRMLYSHNRWDFAKTLSLEELQSIGLLADRFSMAYIKEAIEDAVLALCGGPTGCDPDFPSTCLTIGNIFQLVEWAEAAQSDSVAILCGRYLAAHVMELPSTLSPKQLVLASAICSAKGLAFDSESFRFQPQGSHKSSAPLEASNWRT